MMTQNSHPLGLFYSQAASRNNAFSDGIACVQPPLTSKKRLYTGYDGMTHTVTKQAKNKCCDCSIGDKRQENSWRFKT